MGFSSEVAFLPEADLGIVVRANARTPGSFVHAAQFRIFDLLFDRETDADARVWSVAEAMGVTGQLKPDLEPVMNSERVLP